MQNTYSNQALREALASMASGAGPMCAAHVPGPAGMHAASAAAVARAMYCRKASNRALRLARGFAYGTPGATRALQRSAMHAARAARYMALAHALAYGALALLQPWERPRAPGREARAWEARLRRSAALWGRWACDCSMY